MELVKNALHSPVLKASTLVVQMCATMARKSEKMVLVADVIYSTESQTMERPVSKTSVMIDRF